MKVGDYVWWVVFGHGYAGTIQSILTTDTGWEIACVQQDVGVYSPREWPAIPVALLREVTA